MSTDFLLLMRSAIIAWTKIWVWPLEAAFDRVEEELKKRGAL